MTTQQYQYHQCHDILRYIVAVEIILKWHKYHAYRQYRAARIT